MAYTLPNGSTLDFAQTYTPFFTITSVTRGNPTVTVTATGHTFTVGQAVTIRSGWDSIDGRTFIVQSVSTNNFTITGVDTTDTRKNPAGASGGTVRGVLSWIRVPQILTVSFSGGQQQYTDMQYVGSDRAFSLPTIKSSASLQLVVADDPNQTYFAVIEAAEKSKQLQVQRLNIKNGSDRLYYTTFASIDKNPSVNRDELMTRTIYLAMYGDVTRTTS